MDSDELLITSPHTYLVNNDYKEVLLIYRESDILNSIYNEFLNNDNKIELKSNNLLNTIFEYTINSFFFKYSIVSITEEILSILDIDNLSDEKLIYLTSLIYNTVSKINYGLIVELEEVIGIDEIDKFYINEFINEYEYYIVDSFDRIYNEKEDISTLTITIKKMVKMERGNETRHKT